VKKFPDTLILIGSILLLFMVLTWIIPAGQYDRIEADGRQVVSPESFRFVDQNPLSPWHILMAPLKGFQQASDVIGFVFFIGGAFAIVSRTGAIQAGLAQVIRSGNRHPTYRFWTIPAIMTLFSLGGATFGMAEETLVFILITIPMARAMGYDTIVGVAIPVVGAFTGFAGAFANPFTVGIAQGIAELPLLSGLGYRILVWAIFTTISIAFVMRYAARTTQNPESSLMAGLESDAPAMPPDSPTGDVLTARHVAVLAVVTLTLITLIVGATQWGWYITEMAALFVAMGIVASIVHGLAPGDTVSAFYQGARDMIVAALLIGFARGLLVVAEEGRIIDTILHAIASGARDVSPAISVQIMFFAQTLLNFFVPSGSGQAALTMPVMAPLSDLLGISRQTAVLAYQFGDGISNLIIPTNGLLIALLGVARIPYPRWVQFVWSLVLILSLTAMLLLIPPVTFMVWR
jgi:uncharacterized ion transporter superfamily protein YfcC